MLATNRGQTKLTNKQKKNPCGLGLKKKKVSEMTTVWLVGCQTAFAGTVSGVPGNDAGLWNQGLADGSLCLKDVKMLFLRACGLPGGQSR